MNLRLRRPRPIPEDLRRAAIARAADGHLSAEIARIAVSEPWQFGEPSRTMARVAWSSGSSSGS